MLSIIRSPARVTWPLCYNNIMVFCGTRKQCKEKKSEFSRKYGV